ncbi:MAG TPA: HAMP domain-containing sensor histidine kinase [Actinomycetota bacterium]|nr:HAMP domain-containing sensor histidine kinase [Actinomycetota bacterium]
MTFRRRLMLVSAGAVAVAVAVASVVIWFAVRRELRSQVDGSLLRRVAAVQRLPRGTFQGELPALPLGPDDPYIFFQVTTPGGRVFGTAEGPDIVLPVPEEGGLNDVRAGGVHYRVYAQELSNGFTFLLARSLTEVDTTLRRLGVFLVAVTGGGAALAAALGLGVMRAAAGPVTRLTEATERVTETGDLSLRIQEPASDDEIGRLASSFNAMLGALEASVATQRQLVADASHELRTPITSIRTNLDVLASGAELEPADRGRLLSDVRTQLEELTAIVNDLVELARGEEQAPEFTDVRLDEVVADAAERAGRRWPGLRIETRLEPSLIPGDGGRIARAVGNLLDNAAKWSPPDGEIEVSVSHGTVEVRDHGPGFAEEDLSLVFDRFYRSAAARGMPGSGLGLAIVKQIADAHGGSVTAANAPDGGGAVVRIAFPAAVSPCATD